MIRFRPSSLIAFLLLLPTPGVAQQTVDPDLLLQGEYYGPVDPTAPEHFGLQVVALGEGQFRASLYEGGLPGAGWTGTPAVTLEGTRLDLRLELKNDTHTVVLSSDAATLLRGPKSIAVLKKIVRRSPTLGLQPPPGAMVMFDGSEPEHLRGARITPEGWLMEGADFIPTFKNFRLHLEFKLPFMPTERGQGRGNSGVYLQSRYEVQILDSFGTPGAFNECGSLYRYKPPMLNMCLPPETWQTYDIDFQAPLFDTQNRKLRNAHITVWLNGVKVHDGFSIGRKTGAGKPEGTEPFPIRLQNHSDPVRYRNVWVLDYDRVQPIILSEGQLTLGNAIDALPTAAMRPIPQIAPRPKRDAALTETVPLPTKKNRKEPQPMPVPLVN